MTSSLHLVVLVAIMLVCGVMGGFVNYWNENISEDEAHPVLKRLSAGVSAALVVPLFLNMISSSLLSESRENPLSLLIFAGFCIIAAISSRAFIESITQKVLNRVNNLEKEQKDLDKRAGPVIAAQTEPPPDTLGKETRNDGMLKRFLNLGVGAGREAPRGPLLIRAIGTDEDTRAVIRALGKPRYTWRYLSGLMKDTDLPEEKVTVALDWLVKNDVASAISGLRGRLWGLTAQGRTEFAPLLDDKGDAAKPNTSDASQPKVE